MADQPKTGGPDDYPGALARSASIDGRRRGWPILPFKGPLPRRKKTGARPRLITLPRLAPESGASQRIRRCEYQTFSTSPTSDNNGTLNHRTVTSLAGLVTAPEVSPRTPGSVSTTSSSTKFGAPDPIGAPLNQRDLIDHLALSNSSSIQWTAFRSASKPARRSRQSGH